MENFRKFECPVTFSNVVQKQSHYEAYPLTQFPPAFNNIKEEIYFMCI